MGSNFELESAKAFIALQFNCSVNELKNISLGNTSIFQNFKLNDERYKNLYTVMMNALYSAENVIAGGIDLAKQINLTDGHCRLYTAQDLEGLLQLYNIMLRNKIKERFPEVKKENIFPE